MAVYPEAPGATDDFEGEIFANVAEDDRDSIASGDRVMLIVENDLALSKVLLDAARLAASRASSATPAPAR